MNRKITAFAFARRCEGRATSGFIPPARNRCCCKIDASASELNPQNASRMNSRRVRVTRTCGGGLLDIEKSVQIKQRQSEFLQRLLLQKGGGERAFLGRRRATDGQPVRSFDDSCALAARFFLQPLRERLREFVGEPAVEHLQRLRGVGAGLAPAATCQQRGLIERL